MSSTVGDYVAGARMEKKKSRLHKFTVRAKDVSFTVSLYAAVGGIEPDRFDNVHVGAAFP